MGLTMSKAMIERMLCQNNVTNCFGYYCWVSGAASGRYY